MSGVSEEEYIGTLLTALSGAGDDNLSEYAALDFENGSMEQPTQDLYYDASWDEFTTSSSHGPSSPDRSPHIPAAATISSSTRNQAPGITTLATHPGPPGVDVAGKPSAAQLPRPSRRKPIPRKGHTKSRRGCYNCKRRRIKCQERRPACDHCVKAGLVCEYPNLPAYRGPSTQGEKSHTTDGGRVIVFGRDAHDSGEDEGQITRASEWDMWSNRARSPRPTLSLSGAPRQFSMSDMKYFQHFLVAAYPHLPIGTDKVWVTTIPCAAYQYDYLMSAMLALAASHYSALTGDTNQRDALSHRVLAMRSLNTSLSRPATSRMEKDARMAAALALCFQAVHFRGFDAFAEYCTMVRGCFLIGFQDGFEDKESAFHTFRTQKNLEIMRERITTVALSPCSHSVLDAGLKSMKSFEHLLETKFEKRFFGLLKDVLTLAYDYPSKAYATFTVFFDWPGTSTDDEFRRMIDPNVHISQLLLAHYLAVQHAIIPILIFERSGIEKPRVHAPTCMNSWLLNIHANVEESFRKHLEWPLKVTKLFFELFAPRAFELPMLKAARDASKSSPQQ